MKCIFCIRSLVDRFIGRSVKNLRCLWKSSCKSFLRGTFFVSFRCLSESDKPSASIEERWSLIWEPTRRLRNSNKWKGTGYEKKSKEWLPYPQKKNLYCSTSSGRQSYTGRMWNKERENIGHFRIWKGRGLQFRRLQKQKISFFII